MERKNHNQWISLTGTNCVISLRANRSRKQGKNRSQITLKIGFKNHHHGGFGYQRIFPIERWAFSDADLDACPTKKRTAKCVEPRAGNQSKRVAYERLRFPRFAAPQTERILCRRIRPNRPTYPGLAGERKQSKIRNEESDGSACCLNLDNVSASVRSPGHHHRETRCSPVALIDLLFQILDLAGERGLSD